MQNPTNYYLFSLAISDLLMLLLGLPVELYGVFDVLYPYRFGEFICKSRAFLIEFTSYASILTITCFSVTDDNHTLRGTEYCAMNFARPEAQKNFIYSAFLFFFLLPALLITFVYCHIVIKLKKTSEALMGENAKQKVRTRKSLLRILVSVVVMFFLCWLPFHIQRLLTIFLNESQTEGTSATTAVHSLFNLVFYISGYCYYSNSACNPILYNILSEKYRIAFCRTILGRKLADKIWAGNQSSFRLHYQTQNMQPKLSNTRTPSTATPIAYIPKHLHSTKRNLSLQQNPGQGESPSQHQLKLTLSHPLEKSISLANPSWSQNGFYSDPYSRVNNENRNKADQNGNIAMNGTREGRMPEKEPPRASERTWKVVSPPGDASGMALIIHTFTPIDSDY
ncbi:7 transmembrane receptor (rhodopsin family) domain-containing protein [Ditylenchus destructor]|uniref:7 transmembrane receptor (Rhodopsin family) domain-containing protein n=1 Tax=Ditylenchus destructor TaxID=166010 RepID=A0AAD4MXR0_9BILA|nr:7 transmembrane receptor (rhodopsin family) domain-containing protein [Ditylenchus destructor]